MRCTTLFILFSTLAQFAYGQFVTIPDSSFKSCLLGHAGINTTPDTNISTTEASSFNGTIFCPGQGINTLTGLNAFTNLSEIDVSYNNLLSADFTANVALASIFCQGNQIANLNIGTNPALSFLNCETNNLTSLNVLSTPNLATLNCAQNPINILDVTQNTNLVTLTCNGIGLQTINLTNNPLLTTMVCHGNQLTGLNMTSNPLLDALYCSSNQITNLNLSANTSLTKLFCDKNSLQSLNIANGNNNNLSELLTWGNNSLTCIEVDNVAITTTWTGSNYQFDTWSNFSTSCALSTEDISKTKFSAFPNPFYNQLSIETPSTGNYSIVNSLGQIIKTGLLHEGVNGINLSELSVSTYILKVQSVNKESTSKLISKVY